MSEEIYSEPYVKLRLPWIYSRKRRNTLAAVGVVAFLSLYGLTNRFHMGEARLLPMSWVDLSVPLVPATIWIYLSAFAMPLVAYFNTRDPANSNRFFYSFMALVLVNTTIFWFWPTTYPRGDYPLPESPDPFTYFAFHYFRSLDTAANCAPSLHVSACYLAAFVYLDEQREKFPLYLAWATAIAISTLTTKQHYLIDVLSGAGMAMLAFWGFHRKAEYYEK